MKIALHDHEKKTAKPLRSFFQYAMIDDFSRLIKANNVKKIIKLK
jgi:hypothetical protein